MQHKRTKRTKPTQNMPLALVNTAQSAINFVAKIVAASALLTLLASAAQAAAPFVDNNDGTVTDTSTGLMWDQCSLGLSGSGCTTGTAVPYNWVGAQTQAATVQRFGNYKGYGDWRVPNVYELNSLVKGPIPPFIDTSVFPATLSAYYWTSTTLLSNPSNAWVVNFDDGNTNAYLKSHTLYVRLVRSGQSFGSFGLSRAALLGITQSAATLTATSPVAATGYWLVVPRAAAAPLASEIIAGATNYRGVTATANGNDAMVAATPKTFAISGLPVGGPYDLYLVAKDTAYATTTAVIGPLEFSTLGISASSIVVHPVTPTTLFAGLDSGGVYQSANSGGNWTAINTGLTNLSVKALAIKADGSRLFAGTDGAGVFYGNGGSWTACAALPGGVVNIRSLTISGSTLYAGTTGGVFTSSNGCTSWAALNAGLPV